MLASWCRRKKERSRRRNFLEVFLNVWVVSLLFSLWHRGFHKKTDGFFERSEFERTSREVLSVLESLFFGVSDQFPHK